MIDGVYRLKQDSTLGPGLDLKKGQEFEVVQNVIYMGGYPLDPSMQAFFGRWMNNNSKLFDNVTRNWKKGGAF
jgi:hypothetical protein